ncbi:MAG: methyltransferase [Gammaproteobacteria bacterium]|nr:methyltransferase [Gammaproteobacteria bacterium]
MKADFPGRTPAAPSARNANWLFLRKWMQAPLSVASITPSSAELARAMAASLSQAEGVVVELGGGTGAITQALLASGVAAEKIIIIERDAHFCAFLQRRFSQVRVLQGDARFLKSLLRKSGIDLPVRAVVSGLPFLSMSRRLQMRLLHQVFAVTDGKGPLIQFSYSPFSPLKRSIRDRMEVAEQCTQKVWRNLPPAKVWSFRPSAGP